MGILFDDREGGKIVPLAFWRTRKERALALEGHQQRMKTLNVSLFLEEVTAFIHKVKNHAGPVDLITFNQGEALLKELARRMPSEEPLLKQELYQLHNEIEETLKKFHS